MTEINHFYLRKDEPLKSCLLALNQIILSQDPDITNVCKYGMPFFYYKGKRFCYLWVHKKYNQPYIGIVDGKRIEDPQFITEKRSRMKIMLFDPHEDLPIESTETILQTVLSFYRTSDVIS